MECSDVDLDLHIELESNCFELWHVCCCILWPKIIDSW
jgi:hypothetical protein